MSFKNIGTLLNVNKSREDLVETLKLFGDVTAAGKALQNLSRYTDNATKRFNVLRRAFADQKLDTGVLKSAASTQF